MKRNRFAMVFAFLAAALYALNAPLSKLLLREVPPSMMAALLYLGAGLGMLALRLVRKGARPAPTNARLTRKDLPYVVGMIVLDVLAPILLMLGLSRTSAENASLLNNFEIVATSLLALLLFHEKISRRLWRAIGLITLASVLLSVTDAESLQFSSGSIFVLLASCCWGLENNCTRMLSQSDPQEVVIIKGLGSGAGALAVALIVGERLPALHHIPLVLVLGFVAYGLSIYCFVYAQRFLGAARTSACYAVQPFIGVLLSLLIFREMPGPLFFVALAVMIVGTWLIARDQAVSEWDVKKPGIA